MHSFLKRRNGAPDRDRLKSQQVTQARTGDSHAPQAPDHCPDEPAAALGGIRVHLQTQGQDQHVKKGRVTDKAKRKKLRIEDNQYRQDNCDEREQFPPSFEVPRPCRSNSMRRANKPVADDCQSNQDEE